MPAPNRPQRTQHSSRMTNRTNGAVAKAMPQAENATLFPMFLKLKGQHCLVVGAGAIGEPKIESLLLAGATVRVVAPQATARVRHLARKRRLLWDRREFRVADLDGVFLIVAATSSRSLHGQIYREAQARGVLCNVVDDPQRSDFYYPAVVRRGPLQIAISTGGHSPALAQRLRQQLEAQFGPEYSAWVERLGAFRRKLFSRAMAPERRKRLLHRIARLGPGSATA